jgi:hypothetical protein
MAGLVPAISLGSELCLPKQARAVTDDAAEPGAQFGHARITLAQHDALAFGEFAELLDRALAVPGIGWMGNRLLLHGRVDRQPLQFFVFDRGVRIGARVETFTAAVSS